MSEINELDQATLDAIAILEEAGFSVEVIDTEDSE